MRLKITTTLGLIAAILFAAPMATAHQFMVAKIDVEATHPVTHEDTSLYVMANGDIWKETNGRLDTGVNSHGGMVTGDTPLQADDVCYGTFTAPEVVAWNWETSAGHFGFPPGSPEQLAGDTSNNDVNYIPFTADSGFYTAGTIFDLSGCGALGGTFVEADTLLVGLL